MRRVASLLLCVGCATHASEGVEPTASAAPAQSDAPAPVRAQKNGRDFPEGVLALTWDDGPDVNTLALAEYLHAEHVSATFFVIDAWDPRLSSDPGFGASVYETGYGKLPLLGDLVALGHRVGNHTMHHALLGRAPADVVGRELGDAQRLIDPFLRDELRLFRVPGGDWSANASRAVDGDPYLAELVGPVRWDVDAKDWEGAVWCDSKRPAHDCERVGGRLRVRPDVMADWYAADIARAGRGIVLMHDRVGDVGSRYALDVARRLVPRLVAKGYVFAAPVLAFGAPTERWTPGACDEVKLGDVDGDGRADACVKQGARVVCAMSSFRDEDGLERTVFDDAARAVATLPARAEGFELADVNGDGRADVCARTPEGLSCALALPQTGFDAFEPWSDDFADADAGTIRFADVDGDGMADVCGRSARGLVCARSNGAGFERARLWLGAMSESSAFGAIALGDLDGDGRADVCARGAQGVFCALSTRGAFGRFTRWSSDAVGQGALAMADLNGDGRADVCAGDSCALSNGHLLTKSVRWLDERPKMRSQWARPALGDANGDGRSDYCVCDGDGVRCGLAP